jgi:ankyrin repeat protein
VSSLDNLRKEAKRWLKALRAGDADAIARLRRAHPDAPAAPGLRDVQHALARERGHENWSAMKTAALLDNRARQTGTEPQDVELTALLDAADKAEIARLIELLDRRPDLIDRRGILGGHSGLRTALHFGIHHEPVVRLLVERGADPNIRDEGDNAMPLHFAAEGGDFPIIKLLVEHGADPIGTGDGHELEVLGWLTCFGKAQKEILDYLLAHGAVHNIFSAVAVGDVGAIRAVAARSPADIDRRMDGTNHRRTPLHLAVVKKQLGSLQTLLDLGADTEIADAAGLTALDRAALENEDTFARALIDRGAILRLPAAIALSREEDAARLLREEPDALRAGGRLAGVIVRASEKGSAAFIETLIRHGADVNVRDDPDTSIDGTHGYTALHAAAFHGNAAAAEALLRHGADPTIREDKYHSTPAGWADYAGHEELRDLILAGPIDLFEAIGRDRPDRIPEILQRDPESLNRAFRAYAPFEYEPDEWMPAPDATPLDWAIEKQKHEAVRLLTAHGAAARPAPAQSSPDTETSIAERRQLVATFLQFACWDHHVHGTSDHRMYAHAARRILRDHPWIARDSIYTAVVCGDLQEVERILTERPEAARAPGGARGWEPLLYLCFTRFPHQPSIDNAVAIARALLDRGANPNAFYMAGDSSYTALVGAAGQGEQDSPRQPQSAALFEVLLEHGAQPFDIQVLYNTHFKCDMIWWLDLVYARTHGKDAGWDDPDWRMLDMGGYGPGAYFILNSAIHANAVDVARWALERGASPNVPVSRHPRFKPRLTLYDSAMLQGATEIADLLARHGATRGTRPLDDEEAFLADCFKLDRAAVRSHLAKHPEYLSSTAAIFAAAERDRADVVEMLLDAGVPIEIEDERKQRALHVAAGADARRVAKLLVDRGAFVDPHESVYDSTPLGFALHFWHTQMMAMLQPISRDIWRLTFIGNVDRVRQLLKEEPDLAKSVSGDGTTLLWWLPEDEQRALEIVELLLAHGADRTVRSKNGRTAADWARQAGMPEVARRLSFDDGTTQPPPPAAAGLAKFESLAQDLVWAFETGQPAAMERLREYYGAPISWTALRTVVRERLDTMPQDDRPEGYFALPHAKLLVALQAGFSNWDALVQSFEGGQAAPESPRASSTVLQIPPADLSARMIQPVEMRVKLRVKLHDGERTTTTDVWDMLSATLEGDLDRVRSLVEKCPSLVRCDYNYMPPLHLAVREGHLPLVQFLASRGAVNSSYVTYPYGEPLLTVALDRGYFEIARVLEEHMRAPDAARSEDESGEIVNPPDPERHRFEALVGANALAAVEAMLKGRADLARDELASWGEGVLSGPANRRHRQMIELLIGYGARVPDITKWAHAYYFKHADIAAYLLERGMSPNHMNCHHTTLLHDMAWQGDRRKAALLLDHGAGIDAVDEEFRSTPLGLAARFGRPDIVALLIERGADVMKAGAPWATPLAWARRKGHARVEATLMQAGAER